MNIQIPRRRGIISARADASATEILNELKRTFEAFKAEHTAELAGIKKNFADVVQTEKVDRINAEITALTKSLDEVNAILAAQKLGGGGTGNRNPDVVEHSAAFNTWFKSGSGEASLRGLEAKAGLTTQSNPDGGYLAPETVETTIDRVLQTVSRLRALASVIPVNSKSYEKFVGVGGATGGWVGEEQARTETGTPSLKELEFPVMELWALPFTTQALLDDGIIDIGQWLADEVSITFADKEGLAFVSGTGVKQPRGILSYTPVDNASYAWGSVGYVASGASGAFAATKQGDFLISLYYALKAGYRANASWLMSDATVGEVRKLKDGQGNYLWQPPSAAGTAATILEKPIETDDNMPAIGADSFSIAFADFKRAYLIVDRMGVRVLRDNLTVKGKVGFYTTKRVGGGIQNFEAIKLGKFGTS